MYEVIITHRPDFSEHSGGRYAAEEEAQESARLIAQQNQELVIRTWIRVVREARAQS
jgi:hypothetical protein